MRGGGGKHTIFGLLITFSVYLSLFMLHIFIISIIVHLSVCNFLFDNTIATRILEELSVSEKQCMISNDKLGRRVEYDYAHILSTFPKLRSES